MNGVQVYLYTSMLWRPANGQQSPLPISGYTFCPQPPLPCTLLPYPLTLYYPTRQPYLLTLHYPPYPFLNPRSYTYSPHESLCLLPCASYASPADATQVLTLAYSCKIEKERAVTRCLFSMPEDPYSGSCNPAHRQSSTSQLAWAHYTI